MSDYQSPRYVPGSITVWPDQAATVANEENERLRHCRVRVKSYTIKWFGGPPRSLAMMAYEAMREAGPILTYPAEPKPVKASFDMARFFPW
jgi:hypothetical protein